MLASLSLSLEVNGQVKPRGDDLWLVYYVTKMCSFAACAFCVCVCVCLLYLVEEILDTRTCRRVYTDAGPKKNWKHFGHRCVCSTGLWRGQKKREEDGERERQGGGGGIDREVVYTHNNNTGLFLKRETDSYIYCCWSATLCVFIISLYYFSFFLFPFFSDQQFIVEKDPKRWSWASSSVDWFRFNFFFLSFFGGFQPASASAVCPFSLYQFGHIFPAHFKKKQRLLCSRERKKTLEWLHYSIGTDHPIK